MKNSRQDYVKERDELVENKKSGFQVIKESMVGIMRNTTCKWVTLGGMFRSFEMFSIVYFMPVFFLRNYPSVKTTYSLYNGLIISVAGILAQLAGGIISDRYEKKNRLTKSIVCMTSSLLSIPLIAMATLNTSSFYASLIFFGLRQLIGESWLSPGITMMQATVKP